MIFECVCGRSGTKSLVVAKVFVCPLCMGSLHQKFEFGLNFYFDEDGKKRKVKFVDLDESFLSPREKQVLDSVKICQPCSNKDIKNYLGFSDACMVTGRTYSLAHEFNIPFIVPFSRERERGQPIKWIVNPMLKKVMCVEKELEKGVLL